MKKSVLEKALMPDKRTTTGAQGAAIIRCSPLWRASASGGTTPIQSQNLISAGYRDRLLAFLEEDLKDLSPEEDIPVTALSRLAVILLGMIKENIQPDEGVEEIYRHLWVQFAREETKPYFAPGLVTLQEAAAEISLPLPEVAPVDSLEKWLIKEVLFLREGQKLLSAPIEDKATVGLLVAVGKRGAVFTIPPAGTIAELVKHDAAICQKVEKHKALEYPVTDVKNITLDDQLVTCIYDLSSDGQIANVETIPFRINFLADPQRGIIILEQGSIEGDKQASFFLAECHAGKSIIPQQGGQDMQKAVEYLQRASEQGSKTAAAILAKKRWVDDKDNTEVDLSPYMQELAAVDRPSVM